MQKRSIALILMSALCFSFCGKEVALGNNFSKEKRQKKQTPLVRAAGSSSLFPFVATVAERVGFVKSRTPIVESIGTGGGFKVFCGPEETLAPHVVMASRPISASEKNKCMSYGISDIFEIKIGYDGIVLAASHSQFFSITRHHLFLALAEKVPVGETLIKNPYKTWNDIDPSLPKVPIRILGPAPSSGTRDALVELVMRPSCQSLAHRFPNLSPHHFRKDGLYVDVGANENIIIQKIIASPGSIGIITSSFLQESSHLVSALHIDGTYPSLENIRNGLYKMSRPLFLYSRKKRLTPYLTSFLSAFLDEETSGVSGYLTQKGLIPLSQQERINEKNHLESIILLSPSSSQKDGHAH